MAGLLGLGSQTLGSSKSFNWTWFIELVTSGILVVWFIFYLNRLFATAVSYGIRTYTWHKFRVYIDIQSLQISLLGGRIFFKDISYYGENETILIHNGHLTWRYWLPATRQIDLTSEDTTTNKPGSPGLRDDSSEADPENAKDGYEGGHESVSRGPESRLGISVNGLEWFIYNRTPVYDAIVKDAGARASSASTDAAPPSHAFAAALGAKLKIHRANKDKTVQDDEISVDLDAEATADRVADKEGGQRQERSSSASNDQQSIHSNEPASEDARVSWFHSFVLRFLPIDIDCSKGSISLGNEHTKALIVTTFDKAQGFIGAAASGPADIYRQTFDFDVEHPVVQMKPNPDYNLPQMASAERIIAGTEAVLKRHPWYKPHLQLRKKRRNFAAGIRNLIPTFRKSVESFHGRNLPQHENSTYVAFDQSQPDTVEWHGLDRYMDELDGDDHQAWMNIEYARFSTLLDAPSVHILFFWDTPGTVLEDHIPPVASGLTKDANGIDPPGYGLHIDVYGAVVHYGPWADRMRGELQGIFLPASYKNASPKPPLQAGDARESSLMTISVLIHEEVTLRIPSREGSKDWRWRGRATAVRDAAAMKRQMHKRHFRFRRNAKRRLGPDIRPFGWLAVSVGCGSRVEYVMDMFPGRDGFRNELNLRLKSTRATSSINHATLWSCKEQIVSANLSNPLGWNELHTWYFSITNKHMDMFLLRDHTFLLLDLITDFTAGLKSDYMTFVPFEYIIDIDFDHFNLMLNANDCNIIDSPCDLESNTFLILAFESLVGQVGVPMKHYAPAQNSVQFKGSGQNASLLLKTPVWNTLRTFSSDDTMATLKELHLDGSYTYFAVTSPESTESLIMNIFGGQPRFNLQGFLIRYFMNVKENYFGDNIRFSTLEEYQSRLDQDGRYMGEEIQPPPKKQNDLDVVLSVRADKSCALMPANIYDRTSNLRVDVMLVEADMRFTNHYMDLQVNSSPVEVSLETEVEKQGQNQKDITRCQLFIDSLAAYGHRLFGAPPTEPAYVCNWDFDIGQISGECSTDFLRILISAIICFIFTMDDDENALPNTNTSTIPDVTFLRARAADIRLCLVTADSAFLVELSPTTVSLDDWANRYFSKSLKVSAPNITVAVLESKAAYRQRDLAKQEIPTYACLKTSAKLAVLNRKAGFTERRAMQQEHVRTQDLRTNRTPWLLDDSVELPSVQVQHLEWAREAPAMPVPAMPAPIHGASLRATISQSNPHKGQRQAQNSPSLGLSGLNSSRPVNEPTLTTVSQENRDADQATFEDSKIPDRMMRTTRSKDSAFSSALALSSAWTKPQFPLRNVQPDLKHMPKAQKQETSQQKQEDFDASPDEEFDQVDEEVKHDGIFCKLSDGILGFCTTELPGAIVNLLNEILPRSPASILDDIQRRTVSNIKLLTTEQPGNIDDIALKLPFGLVRMISQHRRSYGYDGYDQYEVCFVRAKATVRVKPYVQAGQKRSHILSHLSVAELTANVAESLPSQQYFMSAAQLSIGDIGLWLSLGSQVRVRTQVGLIEVGSAGRNVTTIAGLVQRTQAMIQDIISQVKRVDLVSREQHFVYHLTLEHTNTADPVFLNRPAYVLRTARNHVRLNDSWKIVSRLRNNWTMMMGSQTSADTCDEHCQNLGGQDESKRRILSSFNQWKAWEATNLDDLAVVQAIFGAHRRQHGLHDEHMNTEIEFLLGRLALTLDPGPKQTQLTLQNIDLNVGDKTVLAHRSGWTFQKQFKRQQTIQLYCGNAAIHVDWEVLEFAHRLIEVLPTKKSPETLPDTTAHIPVKFNVDSDLSIIVGADLISLSAATPNLSLLIGAEIFRTSFLVRETEHRHHEITAMLGSNAGRLRLLGLKRTLLSAKLTLPNIYLGYKQGHPRSVSKTAIHVAATSQQLRFQLKRDILELLKIVDAFIGEELPNLKTLLDVLPQKQYPKEIKTVQTPIDLPELHLALFLNNYRMEFALLPYLQYIISGKTARTSLVPHDASKFSIHVDLKNNEHTFTDRKSRSRSTESFLVMPPVNLRLTLNITPTEVFLNSHSTIELIKLEASAVRTCFDAIYKPSTTQYMRDAKTRTREIQKSIREALLPVPEDEENIDDRPSAILSNKKLRYRVQAVVAGVTIHCAAPPLREQQKYSSDLRFMIGPTSLKLHNERPQSRELYEKPQFQFVVSEVSLGVYQASPQPTNFGLFKMGMSVSGCTELDEQEHQVQHYRAVSDGIQLDLYAETALLAVDIVTLLQDRIKALAISEDAKKMRPLRRFTMSVAESKRSVIETDHLQPDSELPVDHNDEGPEGSLLEYTFALDISAICLRWFVSDHATHSSEEAAESMAFTISKIDLQTNRESSARLAILGLQLQLVPSGRRDPAQRTANSALLPEMIFNAAYVKTNKTRKFAFKAAGKAVNVMLAADFLLPASAVQKSLARASGELRSLRLSLAESEAETTSPQLPKLLSTKRLASLLIFADFAGAEVTISPKQEEEQSSAFGLLKGLRRSRAGRYGQAVQSGAAHVATLRAPGIALRISYLDNGLDDPSLSTEIKVAASSNTLAPSVVPLIQEISSSISDLIGQDNNNDNSTTAVPQHASMIGNRASATSGLDVGDPTAILGRVKLNGGLWVQRQEFSLTCQPIARVSATAKFDDIFVTINTVQDPDHDRFFSVITTFRNLSASVQHVYSRESTASFHVESIVVSLMNSKHFSNKSGISAILEISPMTADLNAKQMQDFLLFREIWYPAEMRASPKAPTTSTDPSVPSQAALQRFQEVTVNNALPWHAIISVQEVTLAIDFGQSIGHSSFNISSLWASSKKNSDAEQNLCIGINSIGIESTGRMSGFVELQGFRVRTAIRWPIEAEKVQTPLVQGSIGFEHLRTKAAFDYQPFTVADISSFGVLIYNVRQGVISDRLVGILDGGKIQAFCTTSTAAQALSIYQAFERLVQEKQEAYETSLHELDRYLRRKSVMQLTNSVPTISEEKPTRGKSNHAPNLQVDVVIMLRAIDAGVFPNTFMDNTTLKLEAVDVQARFAVGDSMNKTHSGLGMSLGQVRVALSSVSKPTANAISEVSVNEVIERATTARGGTILKVPRLVASMETWQQAHSNVIEYIFSSTFHGKVDVGWNYSRISTIRRMWELHSKVFAHRLGKPLPPSAVKITAEAKDDGTGRPGQEKITAVVNMPQSKYDYVALEPPIIDTPQLRDLGEATPSLEWIGLHRERLPHVTHSVIIVSLLELAKEVEDSYSRILGTN